MPRSFRIVFIVLLLWFCGLGAAAQFAKIAVPFAQVGQLYPEAGDRLGWLLSLASLTGALFGTTSGVFAARMGAVRFLLFGLVLGGAVSLWQAALPAFPVMLASRILEGLSHLAIVVAAPTVIAQVADGRFRNAAMALWSTFFGVSFALVAWFGTPVIRAYGLGTFFAAHGLAMFAAAAFLLLFRVGELEGVPAGTSDSLPSFSALHRQAYGSPFIVAPAVGWLFYALTFVSLLAIVPTRLPESLGGGIAGLLPLVAIAVSWTAVPLLLRHLPAVTIVNLGFLLGILIVGLPVLGVSLAWTSVALFSAIGLVQGASFAAVPELNPSAQARALGYGVMAQTGNIGNLLGTPLLLAVLDRYGEAGMLGLVAMLYMAAVALHLLLAARRRRAGGSAA